MLSSSSVRITRMAISPRFATRTFSNIGGRGGYRPLRLPRTRLPDCARALTSRAMRRAAAVLLLLAGGPGQSATDAFGPDALGVLFPAYRNRDLVIFDQRGSGRSGLLRCRRLERANLLRAGAAAGACARALGARRAFYTSRDSDDDIDAIREQLGAEQVALYGTSYGTKVALGYALRYPGRVERLVLDSTVEAEGPDPFYLDTMDAG